MRACAEWAGAPPSGRRLRLPDTRNEIVDVGSAPSGVARRRQRPGGRHASAAADVVHSRASGCHPFKWNFRLEASGETPGKTAWLVLHKLPSSMVVTKREPVGGSGDGSEADEIASRTKDGALGSGQGRSPPAHANLKGVIIVDAKWGSQFEAI